MKVLLLAAGLGTRLRPITNTIPKCLVPIGGKPLLQIWLERLSLAGFGPFLINTHYLHHKVEEFIEGSDFKDDVTLVFEPELLGTAGTLIKNIDFFEGEDGMVLHADNYCLANLKKFEQAHQNRPDHCDLTMMTFLTNDPQSCGIVEVDERGVVVGFHEKVDEPPGNIANGAVYIFSKEALKGLETQTLEQNEITVSIIPKYVCKIASFATKEMFMDIGSPENLLRANSPKRKTFL